MASQRHKKKDYYESEETLLKFDVFQRVDVDHRKQTVVGGIISVIALVIIVCLVLSEFSLYLNAKLDPVLYVDTSIDRKIRINIDITFPSLPCGFVSVNALDKTGNHQLNVHHDIVTIRLDPNGKPIQEKGDKEVIGQDAHAIDFDISNPQVFECGSCYGAETDKNPCCNTCEAVQQAYNEKGWAFNAPHQIIQCVQEGFIENLQAQVGEGCNVKGHLEVSRVAGNFNIVPGKLIMQNSKYVIDSEIYQMDRIFNLSHRIGHLSFGEEFPGMEFPLDGVVKGWGEVDGSGMFEYFVQVVPTEYEYGWWGRIHTNQFSVTEYEHKILTYDNSGVPGFFIMYELSPIMVEYSESSRSFLHFLVNLCAIVGGVYTVASLIDSFIYNITVKYFR